MKKVWNKPTMHTLNEGELKTYIQVAAWSGGCKFGNFR